MDGVPLGSAAALDTRCAVNDPPRSSADAQSSGTALPVEARPLSAATRSVSRRRRADPDGHRVGERRADLFNTTVQDAVT
jgi:hypothetical protein